MYKPTKLQELLMKVEGNSNEIGQLVNPFFKKLIGFANKYNMQIPSSEERVQYKVKFDQYKQNFADLYRSIYDQMETIQQNQQLIQPHLNKYDNDQSYQSFEDLPKFIIQNEENQQFQEKQQEVNIQVSNLLDFSAAVSNDMKGGQDGENCKNIDQQVVEQNNNVFENLLDF